MRAGWVVVLAGCGRLSFGTVSGDAPGAGDARAGDARAGDAAIDSLADAAPDAPYVCTGFVCDSLDGPSLGTMWTIDANSGTVVLDTTRAYRGASSVHLHTDTISTSTTNVRATIETSQGLPMTGTIYARAWIYLASPMPANPYDQIINFAATSGVGISLGGRNGYVVDNDYTTPQYVQSTTVMLPLDRWACLQMTMPSGISGTTHIYVDGAEVTDVATSQTNQPAPDHVWFGIEWVATVTTLAAFDAWIDEIAIDSNPVPCG